MSWERLLSPQRTRQPFLWSSVTVRNLADALLRFYIHAHHGCVIVIAVDVYHKQVSWSRLSMLALGWAHPLVLHIVLSWTSRAMMPVLAVSGSCSKDDVLFSGDYSVFFVVYIYIYHNILILDSLLACHSFAFLPGKQWIRQFDARVVRKNVSSLPTQVHGVQTVGLWQRAASWDWAKCATWALNPCWVLKYLEISFQNGFVICRKRVKVMAGVFDSEEITCGRTCLTLLSVCKMEHLWAPPKHQVRSRVKSAGKGIGI